MDRRFKHTYISTDSEAPTLTTATVKNYLRVSHSSDDSLIDDLVKAAILHIEHETGLSVFARTFKTVMRYFPSEREIRLNRFPITAVSSIQYNDQNGDQQTYSSSNYDVDINIKPGLIKLNKSSYWPVTDESVGNVIITFTTGYASEAAIPLQLRQAILLLTSFYYDQRMPIVTSGAKPQPLPFTVGALLSEFTLIDFK